MNLRAFLSAVSVFLLVTLGSGLIAAEWHVAPPPLGNDNNPGTNELPFATIQHGIGASSHGDTVIVAEGTYVENIKFNGKNIVLTSTDPLDPTVVAGTIIDGNQAGSVATFSGTETDACVLSGFTVRNGSGEYGGGICGGTVGDFPWTHATIQNNMITGNSVGGSGQSQGGGLAFCEGTIQNNIITGNSSATFGGGLAACGGTIRNNTITYNSAPLVGGGLMTCNGTIQNNGIAGNAAAEGGGLAYCDGTIQDNGMSGNTAEWDGGGLAYCNGTIQDNMITGNSAQVVGGGLAACNGTIQNNAIAGNSAGYGGGLAYCDGTIQNNTITGNLAQQVGGGLTQCMGTIQNCIVCGNTAPVAGPQLYTTSIPTYSCIELWTGGGEGNISENPLFVDPDGPDNDPATHEDNNYRLSVGSPCIDAGRNEPWMSGATDLDGNVRVYPGGKSRTVDMGAYEYGSWPFRITRVLMHATGGFQLTWTSRPGDQYVIWSCTGLTAATWTQKQTVLSAGDSATWTDPSPSGRRVFYMVELR